MSLIDIGGNRLSVTHSSLLDFGEKDYIPSPYKIYIISRYQSPNLTQILQTKMLQSNLWQGVEEIIIATMYHP